MSIEEQRLRILFIYPHLGDGSRRMPETKRYFPWGPATVMSALENDGHEVLLLDIYGLDLLPNEVERELKDLVFDCACISGFASYNYRYVCWLAETIKECSSVPVVVGGILADLHYDLLLSKPSIDICVLGEGEITAVELFRNYPDIEDVRGIAYCREGRTRLNAPRELIADLDTLPMPNFSLLPIQRYLRGNLWADDQTTKYEDFRGNLPTPDELTPNFSVFFGRGCPYRCRFCARSYQSIRHKSVDHMVQEITYLKDNFGVRAVHFYDELVVLSRDLTLQLCEKIGSLGVYWDCQGRVNLVDRELMSVMKASKCYSLGFGFESGSDKMLKAMNKRTTRKQNIEVLEAARDVGMHLKIQLMCGYPGETRHTVGETVSMMKRSGLPPRRMSWATPLPGSEIYGDAVRQGKIGNEEEFLNLLGEKPMNEPGTVVLNVSGLSDQEMTRVYVDAHDAMERNFVLSQLLFRPRIALRVDYWRRFVSIFIRRPLAKIEWLRNLYHVVRRTASISHQPDEAV